MSTNRSRPIDTAECRSTRYFRCERADDLRSHRRSSPSWEDKTRTMRSRAVWETGWPRVKSLWASLNYVRRRECFPVQWTLAHAGCRHSGRGIFVLRRRGIRRETPVYTGWASRTLGARKDRRQSSTAAISGHRVDGGDTLELERVTARLYLCGSYERRMSRIANVYWHSLSCCAVYTQVPYVKTQTT